MQNGTIHVILGPMYSGKTTELQRIITRYSLAGKKTVVFKHSSDTRYDAQYVCSHDNHRMEAIPIATLQKELVKKYDVLGIDEGQFFKGIADFSDHLANEGKIVVIAALSSDYRRQQFPEIPALLSIADKIEHLTAVCRMCGGNAPFSLRKSAVRDIEMPGGQELYEACCRRCYNRMYSLFQ